MPAEKRIVSKPVQPVGASSNIAYLVVMRRNLQPTYAEGELYLNNQFFAYTIEDQVRDSNKDGDLDDDGEQKVMHETAIPYGTYEVVLKMSPSKKRILPRLLNVKHFEGILIHKGNTKNDSSGCIIIGFKKGKAGEVLQSKNAEEALVKELVKYKKIFIEIK